MTMVEQRARGWKSELLRRVFLHQNGLAAVTALATLEASGALARLRRGTAPTAELVGDSPSPAAIAASIVAAGGAGWLTVREDGGQSMVSSAVSPDLAFAIEVLLDTHRAVRDRDRDRAWSQESAIVERLLGCVDILSAAKAAIQRQTALPETTSEVVTRLLEGVIAVPVLPRVLTGYDHATLAPLLAALDMGDSGASAQRALPFFAPMYGLAGSYAQALIRLPDRVAAGKPVSPADVTGSIDRSLNVRASAAAHTGYFHAASGLITRMFDELPLPEQPRVILDVGCGDGTWLRRLYEAIRQSTARGAALHQYPLHLVGVDVDPVALEISTRNLHDLPATCLHGDIGEPGAIAAALTTASGVDADHVLAIRAFVDHNRSLADVGPTPPDGLRVAAGVYATPAGSVIAADAVDRDWAAHYAQWNEPFGRHGLVVIEAHTLSIADVNARLATSHSLALQYYHALSGQSPIPYPRFRAAAAGAGLASHDVTLYPDPTPTTSVSRLTAPTPAGLDGHA